MSYPTKEHTALWSDAEYFAYDAVNASSLKHLVKSPQRYQHAKATRCSMSCCSTLAPRWSVPWSGMACLA